MNTLCETILPSAGELHRFTGDMKLRGHLAFVLGKGPCWQMLLVQSPLTQRTETSLPSKLPLLAIFCFCSRSLACLSAPFVSRTHTSPFPIELTSNHLTMTRERKRLDFLELATYLPTQGAIYTFHLRAFHSPSGLILCTIL